MRHIPQGTIFTKTVKNVITKQEIDGIQVNLTRPIRKHYDIFVQVDKMKEILYTDQTRQLPVMLINGHKYIMIMTKIDSNAIISEPIRNKTVGEMIKTYQILIARLHAAGIYTKNHVFDNEVSVEYKKAIKRKNMTF